MKGTTLYSELPLIETSTPGQRLDALLHAKNLLAGDPVVKSGGPFSGNSTEPQDVVSSTEMIRLAEYITTGHDYRDTHPQGKRRPIIKKETHVHVHPAMLGEDGEVPDAIKDMVDHLVHHIENGDFDPRPSDEDDLDKVDPEAP